MLSLKKNILPFCLLLAPMISLGTDLNTPSLPAIMHYFHITHYQAKLTIVLYVAGFGIAQPFMGIISDHVQRKKFILMTLGFYTLTAFASAFSPSIFWLYLFRILNSFCATAIAVVIKSIILDNFSGKMLAKANNYFTLSWSMTPMIAPVLGGFLQHYFNWQANFYFMAIYSFIGFLICLMMFKHESFHLENVSVLSLKTIYEKWIILFSDHIFMTSIFILAIENSILFLYYTVAPFIIQNELQFTAAQYGQLMIFAGGSYLIGNLINARLLNYFSIKNIIHTGLIASLIIPIVTAIFLLFFKNQINIYLVTLPVFLIFMCDGLVFANIATQALAHYKNFSGIAGGLLAGGFNLSAAVVVALCAHWFNLHNLMVLQLTFFILLFFSYVLFLLYFKKSSND